MHIVNLGYTTDLRDSPIWWQNYVTTIYNEYCETKPKEWFGRKAINKDLKKYNCHKPTMNELYFDSEQDFTFFVLRWS